MPPGTGGASVARVTRLLAALLAASLLGAVAPAQADTHTRGGTAPVTAPDAVSGYAENYEYVRVLANDVDAEGDRLTVCGLTPQRQARIVVDFDDPREVAVGIGGRAKPGTWTFTYLACDGTSANPGTLTVTVLEPPRIKVRPVPGRPGKVQASSDADFRIKLTYGGPSNDQDGLAWIPRGRSVTWGTRYDTLYWTARLRDGTLLTRGKVTGIQ